MSGRGAYTGPMAWRLRSSPANPSKGRARKYSALMVLNSLSSTFHKHPDHEHTISSQKPTPPRQAVFDQCIDQPSSRDSGDRRGLTLPTATSDPIDVPINPAVDDRVHGLLLPVLEMLSQGSGLPAVGAQDTLDELLPGDVVGVQLVQRDDDVRGEGCDERQHVGGRGQGWVGLRSP